MRGGREPDGEGRARARAGFAPPREAPPRLGSERVRRAPGRLRHQLHRTAHASDRGRARLRRPGARRGPLRSLRAGAFARGRSGTRRAVLAPADPRCAGRRALSGYRHGGSKGFWCVPEHSGPSALSGSAVSSRSSSSAHRSISPVSVRASCPCQAGGGSVRAMVFEGRALQVDAARAAGDAGSVRRHAAATATKTDRQSCLLAPKERPAATAVRAHDRCAAGIASRSLRRSVAARAPRRSTPRHDARGLHRRTRCVAPRRKRRSRGRYIRIRRPAKAIASGFRAATWPGSRMSRAPMRRTAPGATALVQSMPASI